MLLLDLLQLFHRDQFHLSLYLIEFINSMKRRLRRDVKNTKEYYEALQKEMEAGLSHPNLSESHKQDRLEKIHPEVAALDMGKLVDEDGAELVS